MNSPSSSSCSPTRPLPSESLLWHWRGHRVHLLRCGPAEARSTVLLVHGFGASAAHWRHTIPALAAEHRVLAIDLLGFGASDKPPSRLADEPPRPGAVRYGFDLWADQVVDALRELAPWPPEGTIQLVGNSIGGMVALTAARQLQRQGVGLRQVVLIDCAQRALDDKRAAELPWWEQASRPLLKGLVRQRAVVGPLFRLLARPGFIRRVLAVAYPSGANVDAELVELLHRPAASPGASESFRGFVNLFNDHLAPQLLEQLSGGEPAVPVRLLWGGADPWEAPAEARRWAAAYPCIRELVVLDGLGHCPHDEAPERVNPILRRWLQDA